MINSDTSECQYLLSSFKDRFYAGTSDKDESVNYAYNEPFYTPIFSHRNAAFNTKIDKFNTYKLNLTKTPILDTHIFKLDLSRATCSGIKINPNKII